MKYFRDIKSDKYNEINDDETTVIQVFLLRAKQIDRLVS